MSSSRSLILWISVFSITSPSADFGRLQKTSDFFGRLRNSSEMFGNDRVVFKNPSTPRIKISRLYLRKSWQVYTTHLLFLSSYRKNLIAFLFKLFPPKWSLLNAQQEKKKWGKKSEKEGRRESQRKSQDRCVAFKPKNYLEILLSVHSWTLQANILHLDQKAVKCTTCKQLCGKF